MLLRQIVQVYPLTSAQHLSGHCGQPRTWHVRRVLGPQIISDAAAAALSSWHHPGIVLMLSKWLGSRRRSGGGNRLVTFWGPCPLAQSIPLTINLNFRRARHGCHSSGD